MHVIPKCMVVRTVARHTKYFVAFFLGNGDYWARRVYGVYVYLMTGIPEGSAGCIVNQWFTFYYLAALACSYFVGLL